MSAEDATPPITVGVGALLLRGDRLLVVRRTYGPLKGLWTIPSGYVGPQESLPAALEREVLEETGIRGRSTDLVGVRHRLSVGVNDTFLIFRMEYVAGEPRPDGSEVDAARFLPVRELASGTDAAPFTRAIVERLPRLRGLRRDPYEPPGPRSEGDSYLLYV